MTAYQDLQSHLNRVSRSFSFCIEQLDEPLRRYVAVSYLLCRILDTVEDSAWTSPSEQTQAFAHFHEFLQGQSNGIESWWKTFPKDVSEGELNLLQDAAVIFGDLQKFPVPVREAISEMVCSMSRGMQVFAQRRQNGLLRLKNLLEVNQYCFFVAGLVGEVLARLAHLVEPGVELSNQRVLQAHHFGLFLQKVNLLKDQRADEQQGRYLIPDRQELTRSLLTNAAGAFDYLLSLPIHMRSYRLFCAWSLFLGLATISAVEGGGKVARTRTGLLLQKISQVIDQPEKLKALFVRGVSVLPKDSNLSLKPAPNADPWFKQTYAGLLSSADLNLLGVV